MKLLVFLGLLMMTIAVQCSYHSQISDTGLAGPLDTGANETEDRSEDGAKHGGGHHVNCGFPDPDNDCIPGIGGVDYGNLVYPPGNTDFVCGPPLSPGYYTDPAYLCQVYYVCDQNNEKTIYVCPIGLAFDQQLLTCVPYQSYVTDGSCAAAPSHYDDPQHVFPPGCHIHPHVDAVIPTPEDKAQPNVSPMVKFLTSQHTANVKAEAAEQVENAPPSNQHY